MCKAEKTIIVIVLVILVLAFGTLFVIGFLNSNNLGSLNKTTLPTSEIKTSSTSKVYPEYETELAVFHGGSGEQTYETHIYKINSGHANMGFKYINKTCTTKSWGSSEWNCKTDDSGQFTWTDQAFEIAEQHGAYSYVTMPGDSMTYSIEDFAKIFMMD